MYENSAQLARATPAVRLSRPTPPDNTEWKDHATQTIVEPAKRYLCFDCQHPIPPGKGIQVQRHLSGTPCAAIVHPDCERHRVLSSAVGRYASTF